MHKGLAIAIVAIIGVSMVGVGHMSGSGDNDDGWFSWWKTFDYKKFIGFLNSGGSGDDDDDDGYDHVHDDVDQSPIDHATVSFNIGIRELDYNGKDSQQNIIDECIFSTEQFFEPLCVKCKFLDEDGNKVATGQVIELEESYEPDVDGEIHIPMMSYPPVDDGFPANNDVRNVHGVKIVICGFDCEPVYADFTTLNHGAKETKINQVMQPFGITVSAVANTGGYSQVIIFDGDTPGGPTDTNAQPDPDLRADGNTGDLNNLDGICPNCAGKHFLIIPENIVNANNDDYIDIPDDSAKGGTIKVEMATPMFLKSFVLADLENNQYSKAVAYDSANNIIKKIEPLPVTGDGKLLTITMNAPNTKRLEVTYKDSGGITNIDLKCEPSKDEGCSLGYWKNHPNSWVTYKTTDKYGTIFGKTITVNVIQTGSVTNPSLIQALNAQGGGINNLARQSVAALLNSAALPSTFPYTTAQVISLTQAAITAGATQIENLAMEFDAANNKGGPLCEDGKNCECKKPDKFTVLYNGPSGVKVEIYKNVNDVGQSSKRLATLGPFNNGDLIVLDSNVNLGQSTVNANTVYNFVKNYKSVGVVSIHTSCSQPLFVGQEFFYHQGQSDQIKLTVESGTLNGSPSIPDESCPVPQDCDCDDRKDHYGKYYDNHKKYYDNNKNKFKSSDYKNYMDEHKKYLDDYGKYMDKSDYKKHTDYFKKFLDDNKKKFSSSDYKKYSDVHKKYSDDYKNHSDDCKCDTNDGKDHYDRDDHDKDDKDYKYKYGKDHDD